MLIGSLDLYVTLCIIYQYMESFSHSPFHIIVKAYVISFDILFIDLIVIKIKINTDVEFIFQFYKIILMTF